MSKILVVVDMQNDFINGPLGNKECQEVVPKVVDLIKNNDYSMIITTKDTHDENYLETQEGKNLPVVHCIDGTSGWELNEMVVKALDLRTDILKEEVTKGTFGALKLMDILSELNHSADDIEFDFCGVCTGICVISNAVIAKATLPEAKINIISEACACVTPESHKTALAAMKMLQMNIV